MSEIVTSASTGLGTTNVENPNPEASYALQRQAVAPQNDLFRYLDDHWTIIESFAWSSSAQPGTVLFSRPITPRESFPILEYLSLLRTWLELLNTVYLPCFIDSGEHCTGSCKWASKCVSIIDQLIYFFYAPTCGLTLFFFIQL